MTRARERLILIGDTSEDAPPERWRGGETAADVLAMKTGLDMICPALTHAGACLTIPQEAVAAGCSRWHVFAHTGGAAQAQTGRSEEAVASLLAELGKETADGETLRLLAFVPGAQKPAVRKTTVSAVVRDEKRAAQEDTYAPAEIMRLPRFMQEKQMTGAAIGTAFHRMMRMIDLARLKETKDLQKEIARQLDAMLESGVINAAEYAAVPARMLVSFFASPLGVRLLLSERVEREWAFTFRMEDGAGGAQLVQGVIDCCFIERGKWVLLDYKTDSAKDAQGAIARHRPQLALYARALEQVTKTPVAERVLYLVRAGAGYPV
ncbi:MAG: PD-(D/E)XK nuclease family protein [Eubacteriales bacterium]|nr:PD-(D/E)XK nuclease family protein [Eubacteriales bacterium]